MTSDQVHADVLSEMQTLRSRLTDADDVMYGILENGPWVLIPDPDLRDLVSRYVADTVAAVAAELGLDDVESAAKCLRRPGRLPVDLTPDGVP